MDSSIDSDHSWESHSTGSSGRGTQHSDQGSLGSTQRAALLLSSSASSSGHQDETDGRSESFPSLQQPHQHRLSHDENRVKIQVPCAPSWSTCSTSSTVPATAAPAVAVPPVPTTTEPILIPTVSIESSPRGVVTVLEGPQSGTTLVESLTSETANEPANKVLYLSFLPVNPWP